MGIFTSPITIASNGSGDSYPSLSELTKILTQQCALPVPTLSRWDDLGRRVINHHIEKRIPALPTSLIGSPGEPLTSRRLLSPCRLMVPG